MCVDSFPDLVLLAHVGCKGHDVLQYQQLALAFIMVHGSCA